MTQVVQMQIVYPFYVAWNKYTTIRVNVLQKKACEKPFSIMTTNMI